MITFSDFKGFADRLPRFSRVWVDDDLFDYIKQQMAYHTGPIIRNGAWHVDGLNYKTVKIFPRRVYAITRHGG